MLIPVIATTPLPPPARETVQPGSGSREGGMWQAGAEVVQTEWRVAGGLTDEITYGYYVLVVPVRLAISKGCGMGGRLMVCPGWGSVAVRLDASAPAASPGRASRGTARGCHSGRCRPRRRRLRPAGTPPPPRPRRNAHRPRQVQRSPTSTSPTRG